MRPSRTFVVFALPALIVGTVGISLAGTVDAAQQSTAPITLDSTLLKGYRWRNIGPDRGGRSIAVSGVKGRPKEAYFGATGGGLWKTTDGGENWGPVTDGQIQSASAMRLLVVEGSETQ